MRPTLPSHPNSGWLRRRSARLLAGTTLAITGCLIVAIPALPAQAADAHAAAHSASSTAAAALTAAAKPAAAHAGAGSMRVTSSLASLPASASVPAAVSGAAAGSAAIVVNSATVTKLQTLDVASSVSAPKVAEATFTAPPPNVPALLKRTAPQTDAATLASTASALGRLPGKRLTLVATALSYLGTPYVLGGASHSGIDCSGLTMEAYASIGINLFHGVGAQDAVGHRISAAQAKPGDLLVFDNEQHVTMYLGNGLMVAAREPGTQVQIEPLSKWAGIGYHFTRILSD